MYVLFLLNHYVHLNVVNMSLSQVPGSLTRGFQGSFLLRVVFCPIIQWESMGMALEAIQPGKISSTLVWIEDRSQMVWVFAHLEMGLDQLVEEMAMEGVDYRRRTQAECILIITGAAKWEVA